MTLQILILSGLIFLVSNFAQAQRLSFGSSTRHEVDLSLSSARFESYETEDSNQSLNVYAAYHRQINDQVQIGGEGGLLSVPDGNDTKTTIAALGLYTYNLESPIRESLYLQAGAGLYPAYKKNDNEYESDFAALVGAGMRFEVWGKINYKPYVRLWKRGSEDLRYEVQLLNFSIFY